MSAGTWIALGALGGVGAVLRYMASRASWGIVAVNLAGAFAVGLVGTGHPALAAGLLGALTTFSTWMLDADVHLRNGRRAAALALLAGSLAAGLLAVWAGRGLA